MASGRAPKGKDEKSVDAHHLSQNPKGAIAEVSGTMHKNNHKALHINYNTKSPTPIDRNKFNNWRKDYWKERAKNYQR